MDDVAIDVCGLSHHYGARQALCDLNLVIARREVFGVLGPNGGGKTTLFRVLSTLIRPQTGSVRLLGRDVITEVDQVRRLIGVVFQAPSLDQKLTVIENLWHQAVLYGVTRGQFAERSEELLRQLGLTARRKELVETLSGGLRRRVELAKGMVHRPALLLMDEPSTGLDPAARSDLWQYLGRLREAYGVTVVLTTHLLEEADRADRLAILSEGELVALGTPDALRASLADETITIETDDAEQLAGEIRERFDETAVVIDGSVRLERSDGHELVGRMMHEFADRIRGIRVGRPTLEDVFIHRTGHYFWQDGEDDPHDPPVRHG